MIQIWLNVPKAHKWDEPYYQAATAEQLPFVLEQEGVQLRLAIGELEGKRSPMKSFTPVTAIIGTIDAGKAVQLSARPGDPALLYIFRGEVTVNGTPAAMHQLYVFDTAGDEIEVIASSDAGILFLTGEPINEPIAAKDNFVMNTAEEVEQALEDYRNGVFGTLEY